MFRKESEYSDKYPIFVISTPKDLDTEEAISLLKEKSDFYADGDKLFISQSGSWETIEPEIRKAILAQTKRYEATEVGHMNGYPVKGKRVIVRGEISGSHEEELDIGTQYVGPIKELAPDFSRVYGVNMSGDSPFHRIDNHSNSVLEQIAHLLNHELDIDQQFVVANFYKGTEGIKSLAHKYWFNEEQTSEVISDIKKREEPYKTIQNQRKNTHSENTDGYIQATTENMDELVEESKKIRKR